MRRATRAHVLTRRAGVTHIFGAHFPYSGPFCDLAENQRYFDWVADTFELRDDIVFDTEVRALTWDEGSSTWEIEIEGPEARTSLRSNAVVTAVGFLNRPKTPEINGMRTFAAARGTRLLARGRGSQSSASPSLALAVRAIS